MKKECRVIPIEPIFMYVISDDDKIAEGDWFHNLDMRSKEFGIIQADKRLTELANNAPSCKKIIASNDPELNVVDVETGVCGPGGEKEIVKELNVPFIPESFIFINKYSIDGCIKIWVEYELDGLFQMQPKINSDNQIIIHTTNDSTFDPNSKGREVLLPKSLLVAKITEAVDSFNGTDSMGIVAGLIAAKDIVENFDPVGDL